MKRESFLKLIGFMCAAGLSQVTQAGDSGSLEAYLGMQNTIYVCKSDSDAKGQKETLHTNSNHAQEIIRRGGYLGPCATYGDKRSLGDGHFQTYAQTTPDGKLWAIGIAFPESTFSNLPQDQYDGLNCFDSNGNGVLDLGMPHSGGLIQTDECSAGHSREMDFPLKATIAPFKWALVNWQARGHTPDGVYDTPHFDFHFFTQDMIERNFIRVGPCALLINCDDMVRGQAPIPAGYLHADFIDVGAVESRMGNHLIDSTSGEWHGSPFTETWFFGAYDGKVTFWEPMITKAYLESHPFVCKSIKLPQKYQQAGAYPTSYCIRYRSERHDYTISLEDFVSREAN